MSVVAALLACQSREHPPGAVGFAAAGSAASAGFVELAPEHAQIAEGAESFVVALLNTGERVRVEVGAAELEPAARYAAAAQLLERPLRCPRTEREHAIDVRLIEVLHQLARAGAGVVEVVSAFRAPRSRAEHNYHTRGEAADVRVPGLRFAELVALARRLQVPGIGVYPRSQMLHVDVREVAYTWTDWSPASRP